MKDITLPSVEIIRQGLTLDEIFEHILNCSIDKPNNISPAEYVDMCIKNKDYNSLSHGTVYLNGTNEIAAKYDDNFFSEASWGGQERYYITIPYDQILVNDWKDDLKYLSLSNIDYFKRITVKFNVSYALILELMQYQCFRFSQRIAVDDFFSPVHTTLNTLSPLIMTGFDYDWEYLLSVQDEFKNQKESYYVMSLLRQLIY